MGSCFDLNAVTCTSGLVPSCLKQPGLVYEYVSSLMSARGEVFTLHPHCSKFSFPYLTKCRLVPLLEMLEYASAQWQGKHKL